MPSSDAPDDAAQEAQELGRAVRRGRRRIVLTLALHGLLVAVLVGGPWLRGRLRAADARLAFSDFGACLWDGTPVSDPGLGLPAGERERFAEQYWAADPAWPDRCLDPLARIPPAQSWFLFPDVKHQEEQVRKAAELVRRQLRRIPAERSAREPVGSMSYRATQRLIAGLSLLARAAGEDRAALDRPAFRFAARPSRLVQPTRVPLAIGGDPTVELETWRDGARALVVGRRHIGEVAVGRGTLEQRRADRPTLVRALLRGPGGSAWKVYAMGRGDCAATPDRCMRRATGFAPFGEDGWEGGPRWVAAHPAGAVRRHVSLVRGSLDSARPVRPTHQRGKPVVEALVLAQTEAGHGAVVRRFQLTPTPSEAPEAKRRPGTATSELDPARPLAPHREVIVPRASHRALAGPDVVWTDDAAPAVHVRGTGARSVSASFPLPSPARWLEVCREGESLWAVVGVHQGIAVHRLRPGAAPLETGPRAGTQAAAALRDVPAALHDVPAALHDVRLACDAEGVAIVGRLGQRDAPAEGRPGGARPEMPAGTVVGVSCRARGCGPLATVSRDAELIAVAKSGSSVVVAVSAGTGAPVQVAPLGERPRPVSPCWTEEGGFCGEPLIAADSERVIVAARQGADLLLVETRDGARTVRPMGGLR